LGSVLPSPKIKDRLSFPVFLRTVLTQRRHCKRIHLRSGRLCRYGCKGEEPVTLGPRQTFCGSPNDIHTLGRNPSKTTLAKFLAFLMENKDASISIPRSHSGTSIERLMLTVFSLSIRAGPVRGILGVQND
jgi:hypothetical protein